MRIDMHAHYVPPKALDAITHDTSAYGVHLEHAAGGTCPCFQYGVTLRPVIPALLDLEERWDIMQRMGVDHQILSVWADMSGYGLPMAEAARWHRLLNDSLCEVTQRHAQKLSALVSVPLQNAHLAARELEHGVRQGGAVGAVVAGNVNNVSLGEVPLEEFWAALVELDVPVFIHPSQPDLPPRTRQYNMLQVVQFTYDTTATVGSLIFSGVLDRFPTLKIILSHGGGYFPYQAGRFDRIYRNLSAPTTPAQPPSAYLRRFYYDTILYEPEALCYLRDKVGSDRLLLGTDYPFPVYEPEPLRLLDAAQFSADDIRQISGERCRQLFKLPGTKSG